MIKKTFSLDFQWPTQEPFLFCAHHYDFFPKGQKNLGPDSKFLKGRNRGEDFNVKDGFRMYHGDEIPGFPVHPHRGFETVTIVRKGYVDHADSLGAAGRYGEGDVQWMTAGAGVQHSEMFPLLHQNQENTAELFQIWLNLPKKHKMVPAHFKMLWSEKIPLVEIDQGRGKVSVIAGSYNHVQAVTPPPNSWASDAANEVLILLIKLKAGGTMYLPKSLRNTMRTLYFFEGQGLSINGNSIQPKSGVIVDDQIDLEIRSQSDNTEILILQASPIGEPTFQHGPFVMNTREEIIQTIHEYQQTQFGGWPWPRQDMVHGPDIKRFAKNPDGKIETP